MKATRNRIGPPPRWICLLNGEKGLEMNDERNCKDLVAGVGRAFPSQTNNVPYTQPFVPYITGQLEVGPFLDALLASTFQPWLGGGPLLMSNGETWLEDLAAVIKQVDQAVEKLGRLLLEIAGSQDAGLRLLRCPAILGPTFVAKRRYAPCLLGLCPWCSFRSFQRLYWEAQNSSRVFDSERKLWIERKKWRFWTRQLEYPVNTNPADIYEHRVRISRGICALSRPLPPHKIAVHSRVFPMDYTWRTGRPSRYALRLIMMVQPESWESKQLDPNELPDTPAGAWTAVTAEINRATVLEPMQWYFHTSPATLMAHTQPGVFDFLRLASTPPPGCRRWSKAAPPMRVKPIAEEIATLIAAGSRDDRLNWTENDTCVRVSTGLVIEGLDRTADDRRRRFCIALGKLLPPLGWTEEKGKPRTYRKAGETR